MARRLVSCSGRTSGLALKSNLRTESCPSIEYTIHIGGPKAEVEAALAKYAVGVGIDCDWFPDIRLLW